MNNPYKYTDPNGKNPILALGAGISLGYFTMGAGYGTFASDLSSINPSLSQSFREKSQASYTESGIIASTTVAIYVAGEKGLFNKISYGDKVKVVLEIAHTAQAAYEFPDKVAEYNKDIALYNEIKRTCGSGDCKLSDKEVESLRGKLDPKSSFLNTYGGKESCSGCIKVFSGGSYFYLSKNNYAKYKNLNNKDTKNNQGGN